LPTENKEGEGTAQGIDTRLASAYPENPMEVNLTPIRKRLSAKPLKADDSTVRKRLCRKLFPYGKSASAAARKF
jgi:hypothetical protein